MADLLLEIGLEEIPARMIAAAQAELATRIEGVLTRQRLLATPGAAITSYSTPRRLAVRAEGVLARQLDMQEQLTGPSWKAAFPDGQPGPAAQAFARKAGVAVAALEKITTPKGEYASALIHRPGRAAEQVLSEELPREIGALSWPKAMYWRPNKPERFVRPLRWLLCLLDDEVVPLEFAGIRASNVT
jgi:glycyl-tRNA synthetase beta chain